MVKSKNGFMVGITLALKKIRTPKARAGVVLLRLCCLMRKGNGHSRKRKENFVIEAIIVVQVLGVREGLPCEGNDSPMMR